MLLFCQEPVQGNMEYKRDFFNMTGEKLERYSTQLKYRIIEGNGKAIYIIGIEDDGKLYGISSNKIQYIINLVNHMCSNINSKINCILKCNYSGKFFLIFILKSLFDVEELPFICN